MFIGLFIKLPDSHLFAKSHTCRPFQQVNLPFAADTITGKADSDLALAIGNRPESLYVELLAIRIKN